MTLYELIDKLKEIKDLEFGNGSKQVSVEDEWCEFNIEDVYLDEKENKIVILIE